MNFVIKELVTNYESRVGKSEIKKFCSWNFIYPVSSLLTLQAMQVNYQNSLFFFNFSVLSILHSEWDGYLTTLGLLCSQYSIPG